MTEYKFDLTEEELLDIRMAVIAKLSDIDPAAGVVFAEQERRLNALSDKLARISVFGHA